MSCIHMIEDILAQPSEAYRPYPFWFWNGRLTREEITWQLEECHRKRITAVLIHPRYGLVTDYLGPEYMEMVVHTVREAKRLGMKVWLYDEHNWPSGTVAGRLLRDYPEYRMRMLHYSFGEVDGPCAWRFERPQQAEPFLVQGCELGSGEIRSFPVAAGGEVAVPAGRWAVAAFSFVEPALSLCCTRGHRGTAPQAGYLDTLDAQAVGQFIRQTHEVYYEHLKDDFGSVVVGFFTDEPGVIYDFDFSYDYVGAMSSHLPWTRRLEERFVERAGYVLRDRLIHLVADVPGAAQTRTDFWSVITSLYTENYHGQLSAWCRERDIAYTGHVVCEEQYLHYQGDLDAAVAPMDVPGLDWTSRECDLDIALCVFQNGRMIASTAHRNRRSHVVCETFGASAWDITLADMKRVTDCLYAMGVNLMCLHGFFYNVGGSRAYECPPSEFFHSPWWEHMGVYSDYTARLGALLSQGRHAPDVGVLVPTRSYWARNPRTFLEADDPYRRDVDRLGGLLRELLNLGVDFECLADAAFADAEISPEGVAWGDERIDTLLLPPVAWLPVNVWNQLQKFADTGGTILTLGPPPRIEGDEVDSATVADVLGQSLGEDVETFRPTLQAALAGMRLAVFENDQLAKGVVAYRRLLEDGQMLCFACEATGRDRPDCELRLTGAFEVHEIDVERADIAAAQSVVNDGQTHIRTSFRKSEGRLFLLRPNASPAVVEAKPSPAASRAIELDGAWDFQPDRLNVLKMSDFVSIPTPTNDGAEVHLHLHCDVVPAEASLLLEDRICRDIRVNYRRLSDRRVPCRYFDSDQYAVDISDVLRAGLNRISLMYRPEMEDAVISPLCAFGGVTAIQPHVFVIGRFGVDEERHLVAPPAKLAPGPWETQGYPHFAGIGTYRTTVSLTQADLASRVELQLDVAENAAEVFVNGRPVGLRAWKPYVWDVTTAVQPGENTLEIRVANTAANLHHPLEGEWNWNNSMAFLRRMHEITRPSGLQEAKLMIFE